MKNSKIVKLLSNPKLFFWANLWLIVLLIAGTLAQKQHGLFYAQEMYFSSLLLPIPAWGLSFSPLPGGMLTMSIIFIGLVFKLLFRSKWSLKQSGIIVIHIGAMILLLGGFLTGIASVEGNLKINEKESGFIFQEYNSYELTVTDTTSKKFDKVTAFAQGLLTDNSTLSHKTLPFQISIANFFLNCSIKRRVKPISKDKQVFGLLNRFEMKEIAVSAKEGSDRPCILFELKNAEKASGNYGLFLDQKVPQTIKVAGNSYKIELNFRGRKLPFTIELIDFIKDDYAGTQMAKSYVSIVNLIDGNIKRRVVIEMNQPLRYKGYTLFQSSFGQEITGEYTVLQVVKNSGRLFPYFSSIIMCIGILIHLVLKSPKLFREDEEKEEIS